MRLKQIVLTIISFVAVTFAVQGLSHFYINAEHFAAIDFVRDEPIMALGFAVMIVQALVMSFAMSRLWPNGANIRNAMAVSISFGLFLGSYIVLTEPAKYAAPSVPEWILVESTASAVQFIVFGLVLGLIYRKRSDSVPSWP